MNDSPNDIPDFADLAADPEIAPLLNFVPVVRKIKRPDGWTHELQRELIARIAAAGTVQAAVWQMGKHATGAEALYKTPGANTFRQSWDAAVIIGRRRNGLDSQPPYLGNVPGITRRAKLASSSALSGPACPQCGRAHPSLEEEAEAASRQEAEEARERIMKRIDRMRRRDLLEMRGNPDKRRAYEVLNGPVDWDNVETYSVFGETMEALRRRM